MKRYEMPKMNITRFAVEDVITQSGVIVDAGTFTGNNADMYAIYKENSSVDSTNVAVFTW